MADITKPKESARYRFKFFILSFIYEGMNKMFPASPHQKLAALVYPYLNNGRLLDLCWVKRRI